MFARPTQHRFHSVHFDDRLQGAAFVAALSRVLASPQGTACLTGRPQPEVWAHADGSGITVYLSDGALEAAVAAFASVPVRATLTRAELPGRSGLLIGDPTAALGLEEAQRLLNELAFAADERATENGT